MSEASPTLHQDLQDLIGQTIAGRYRVDELLGVGGMGAVFSAHHIGLKRDMAIKVLHPDLTRHPEISARFDREAHSASRLDHPNCLQVTDYGSTEHGMKFMVMQLLTGQELTSILGEPLPPARAVPLAIQLLRGLEHAHSHGVVHRDVKPENVFIVRDREGKETLKLVDFGIAKIVGGTHDTEKHKTQAGLVFGTPAYMSPEQASGLDADERADLYSVGIILYEMLAGHAPFDHEDPVTLVRMQVGADPPPLPSSVPPVLAAVVEKLLAKDRDERFQSATEAAETLEGLRALIDPEYMAMLHDISSPLSNQFSGAINIANSQRVVLASPARGRWLRDWRLLTAGGALAVLAVVGGIQLGFDAAPDESATPGQVSDGAAEAEISLAVDDARLAELDRLIMADKLDEADATLSLLRDEFPKDAELLWRQGRLLTKRRRKDAQALAAYGAALDIAPSLLEDRDFYAELHELLRGRRVREEALDLALHKMGVHGHKFLLELVNNEKRPLSYVDRRRALEELASDPDNGPLINTKLNLALDLVQADAALTPCVAYEQALGLIEGSGDPFFKPYVESAEPPDPDPNKLKHGDDATRCEGLQARREHLLARLTETVEGSDEPGVSTDTGKAEPPADKQRARKAEAERARRAKARATAKTRARAKRRARAKSRSRRSRKRSGSGRKSSGAKKRRRPRVNKCQKLGGIFDGDCWS